MGLKYKSTLDFKIYQSLPSKDIILRVSFVECLSEKEEKTYRRDSFDLYHNLTHKYDGGSC